jgi:hypothetical protein
MDMFFETELIDCQARRTETSLEWELDETDDRGKMHGTKNRDRGNVGEDNTHNHTPYCLLVILEVTASDMIQPKERDSFRLACPFL